VKTPQFIKSVYRTISKRLWRDESSYFQCLYKFHLAGYQRIYSTFDEQIIIKKYLSKLHGIKRFCVDIAAGDGVHQSNTYSLYRQGWGGLAVECDSQKYESLAASYSSFNAVRLHHGMSTPLNILGLLAAAESPHHFGLLNLDIDGYDHFVLKEILKGYRPSLMCVEINEKIPPPYKFTVLWDSNYLGPADNCYGQSICQLHSLCHDHSYDLVEIHFNNAFFIASEINPFPSLSSNAAYKLGYLDQKNRLDKMPWNREFEPLLQMNPDEGLKFIHEKFNKHQGRYTLSL
jgi:hypothetical protein